MESDSHLVIEQALEYGIPIGWKTNVDEVLFTEQSWNSFF